MQHHTNRVALLLITFVIHLSSFQTQGNTNGICNPIKNQANCEARSCFYCAGNGKCRVSEDICPPSTNDGDDEDGDGDGDGGPMNGICNRVQLQVECEELGCFYCIDKGKCRISEDRCDNDDGDVNGGSVNGICNRVQSQVECEELGCFYCIDKGKCRVSEERCSVEDENEDGDGGSMNGICNAFRTKTECEFQGCFYCEINSKCRVSEDRCSDEADDEDEGSRNGICNPILSQSVCEANDCYYCSDKAKCRTSVDKCPGVGNPCKDLVENACSISDSCQWCSKTNTCTGARGARCPSEEGFAGTLSMLTGNACGRYSSELQCTISSTSCRWCPSESKCKKGNQSCDDGSAGIRGNPCRDISSVDECTSVAGCLWCASNDKCKKAIDGCDEDNDQDTNICKNLEFQADCEEVSSCQWCVEQSKCKLVEDECGRASDSVEIALETQAAEFIARNGGLASSDPMAINVKLSYLFEITADGLTGIGSSFVDLENQSFNVEQMEGTFNGIKSRRISFTAGIDGVGSIELEVFLILEDGSFTTPSGDFYNVNTGDVKFSMNLLNWSFCDSGCGGSSASSSYIDIAMEIGGSSESPLQDSFDPLAYDLGGVPLSLSNEAEVDGVMTLLPAGYPRIEETEQGTVFIFRFPRFSESMKYDPIIETNALRIVSETTPSPSSAATKVFERATPAPSQSDPNSSENSGGFGRIKKLRIAGIWMLGALWGHVCG